MLYKRVTIFLVALAIAGVSTLGLSFNDLNQAYAQRLVTATEVLSSATALKETEARHYWMTEYVRSAPSRNEPADPYHRTVAPFQSSERIIEVWESSLSAHSIVRLKDAEQTILSEFISTPATVTIYDAIAGTVISAEKQGTNVDSAATDAKRTIDSTAWVNGITRSAWGTTAWLVEMSPTPALPTDFLAATGEPALHSPTASDLNFLQTQTTWEIDQQTGFPIAMKIFALTTPEPTLLYSLTRTQPEMLSAAAATDQLNNFTAQDVSSLQSQIAQNANLNEAEITKLVEGVVLPAEAIADQVNFPLLTVSQAGLQQMKLAYHSQRTYFAPEHSCHLERPLAYDFGLCAGLGKTVRFQYFFSNAPQENDFASVDVLLGKKSEVVPMLQKALPTWEASQPITLTIADNPVSGWQISGVHGDPQRNTLVFEYGDTFVQLSGYKVSSNDLIQLSQHLVPVNDDAFQGAFTLYMPLVPIFTADTTMAEAAKLTTPSAIQIQKFSSLGIRWPAGKYYHNATTTGLNDNGSPLGVDVQVFSWELVNSSVIPCAYRKSSKNHGVGSVSANTSSVSVTGCTGNFATSHKYKGAGNHWAGNYTWSSSVTN